MGERECTVGGKKEGRKKEEKDEYAKEREEGKMNIDRQGKREQIKILKQTTLGWRD